MAVRTFVIGYLASVRYARTREVRKACQDLEGGAISAGALSVDVGSALTFWWRHGSIERVDHPQANNGGHYWVYTEHDDPVIVLIEFAQQMLMGPAPQRGPVHGSPT
jgi:hypothetical protein